MHRVPPAHGVRAPRPRARAASVVILSSVLALGPAGCSSPDGGGPAPANGQGQPGGAVQDPQQAPLTPELEPFRPLLGKSIADAERWLAQNPTSVHGTRITRVRPVVRDGEDLIVTMDYRDDRLNVAIRDEVIVGLESIG